MPDLHLLDTLRDDLALSFHDPVFEPNPDFNFEGKLGHLQNKIASSSVYGGDVDFAMANCIMR
jgi:hypothetical protein